MYGKRVILPPKDASFGLTGSPTRLGSLPEEECMPLAIGAEKNRALSRGRGGRIRPVSVEGPDVFRGITVKCRK